ncbi:carboxy terminal-processing peptidase [Stieleria varia]|uniref:Tail-specific protease n=1 Tax=Stieleria varia TaxID=2528005 RepID=A0A5C6B1N9_9BACT|nr:carboxy terminal-processing peptidase [Stieleria varia]TWU05747.1 Tail-specific protease precursor [Stieleria varia]
MRSKPEQVFVMDHRVSHRFLASLLALSFLCTAVLAEAQELPGAGPKDRTVARLIARLMPEYHVSGSELDDSISKRALDLYLDQFDPLKLYFRQSDVDEFRQYSTQIDDMVREGDLSLAYKIFGRFNQRVSERVEVAMKLLKENIDFNKEEVLIIDPEKTTYAKTDQEADERWRRQIKYALLDLKDDDKTGEEALDLLRRRYSRYARRWKSTDSDDLLEMYLTAVTMGYDPHSTYMSPSTYHDFQISMNLELEGIGAALREKDGNTVVMDVIPGGAADQDGKLKPDDVIIMVGQGEEGEMVDIVEMPLKDVVDLIRGNAGTTVRLGVKVGGKGTMETYKITRAKVELEESAARGKVIEHNAPDGTTKKIGFINLPSFYMDMEAARLQRADFRSSTRDVRRILADFRRQGVEGVVLDLSRNGGGSLTEAINLTGLFINRGPVVQVKDSDGQVTQYADEESGTDWNGPLVVLTSKFSASASEIFAGAIKDYGRGIIVGDPATHGKGTVQTLMDVGQRIFSVQRKQYGALKVTLQQFYLPDGRSTQREGVAADLVLPSLTQKMDVAESDLKYALESDQVSAAPHDVYGMVPANLLAQLRSSSAKRVENNQEFVDLIRRVNLYVKQKEENSVPLKEDEFFARRKELDAQKEDEEKELEQEVNEKKVFADTFYNKEVLSITAEYIQGLREQNLAQAG